MPQSNKNNTMIKAKNHQQSISSSLTKNYKHTNKDDVESKIEKESTLQENSQHHIHLLDKVVYEWFQRAQRLIETGTITNEMFIQKALETKEILGIRNLETTNEWVLKFRKKYNITNLDMSMLRIENDSHPLSVNIYDIIVFVMKQNPAGAENSHCKSLQDNSIESTYPIQDCSDSSEIIIPDDIDETSQSNVLNVLPFITNDEQARRYLKPLEDYVLMTENFRAIGLISQLEEIFQTETNV